MPILKNKKRYEDFSREWNDNTFGTGGFYFLVGFVEIRSVVVEAKMQQLNL
jgi:hypothetical protein